MEARDWAVVHRGPEREMVETRIATVFGVRGEAVLVVDKAGAVMVMQKATESVVKEEEAEKMVEIKAVGKAVARAVRVVVGMKSVGAGEVAMKRVGYAEALAMGVRDFVMAVTEVVVGLERVKVGRAARAGGMVVLAVLVVTVAMAATV